MQTNKRMIHVLVIISLMFLSLVTYLLYFNMFNAEELAAAPENKRRWEEEKRVKRGTIYDCNGEILAETVVEEDSETDTKIHTRDYPYNNLYSHIIGYYSQTYGTQLLEEAYDNQLMDRRRFTGIYLSELRPGNDLNLTIDNNLQTYAYEQLNSRSGAIVALEPSTGKILAMVSYPDFDPNLASLDKNWSSLNEQTDSPLLPRATSGLYPPGSTYKIVTAALAYSEGYEDETFDDDGAFEENGLVVNNYGGEVFGELTLPEAFEVSSNDVFCSIGYELGAEKVTSAAEKFGINKDITTDIPVKKSTTGYENMVAPDAALVSIGQGKLLMTPLHVAMLGAAVANEGKMMKPYLVKSVTTSIGDIVSEAEPTVWAEPMTKDCAEYLNELMINVVESGTGKNAKISGITVAGKTGTAENENEKKDHAWFVGYAPAEDPEIAVAVLLEYDGSSGGRSAAPIARNIIKEYLGK